MVLELNTTTNTPQIVPHNRSIRFIALKPHKDTTKKEIYSPIPFINIDAKVPNKLPANQVQEHIREINHHDQADFIPGCRDGSTYENLSL